MKESTRIIVVICALVVGVATLMQQAGIININEGILYSIAGIAIGICIIMVAAIGKGNRKPDQPAGKSPI